MGGVIVVMVVEMLVVSFGLFTRGRGAIVVIVVNNPL